MPPEKCRNTPQAVYVVEDDETNREVIVAMLEQHGCEVFAFASAEALLAAAPLQRPACVILDIGLPGMGGLQLQKRLQQDEPGLPVVIVTGVADIAIARGTLLAGAADFLLKPIEAGELIGVVRRSLASDEARVRRLQERAETERRVAGLSEREREVFRLVTDGLQNREIARQLGVSVRTVEAHRAKLIEKLKVERSAELFHIRARLDSG
jgi:RNA polymerase sigma factor (sigma-70 family)